MRSFGFRAFTTVFSLALAVIAPPALAQDKQAPPITAPVTPQAAAAQAEAKKLSEGFVAVAERVSPAVVQIDVTARDENADPLLRFFGKNQDSPVARSTGSGVIFSADGAILTNNHVIDHALTINVRLRDGRLLSAKLLGRDPGTDLAVIKVDATGLTAARFADSDGARVGEWVVAIGSPFGLGYTVTTGVLSAKGRGVGMNEIQDYLQTDASINPGNSGGPLCDLNGAVLGINTMIVGRGAGIGFAVPSNLARRVGEQILKKGKVERAWIGIGFQDLTPELASSLKVADARAGVLVNSVTDGGPAQKANIKPGDVIAGVGGKKVTDGRELVREIIGHEIGQNVALEIIRDGKRYGSSALLTARPEAAVPPLPVQQQGVPQAGLGLSVRDLTARPEAAVPPLPVQQQGVPQAGLGLSVRDLTPQQATQLGVPSKPLP
ncbi:MAG TPA: trypsin-like peptidase domain-containing protein, partial [Labilithrix sp.]|nr:trypsin-like peptidase domain-containing protein [Labilithrix sp.]